MVLMVVILGVGLGDCLFCLGWFRWLVYMVILLCLFGGVWVISLLFRVVGWSCFVTSFGVALCVGDYCL